MFITIETKEGAPHGIRINVTIAHEKDQIPHYAYSISVGNKVSAKAERLAVVSAMEEIARTVKP